MAELGKEVLSLSLSLVHTVKAVNLPEITREKRLIDRPIGGTVIFEQRCKAINIINLANFFLSAPDSTATVATSR